MLVTQDPREAYRRSAFDARIEGGDTRALVDLCLEQAIGGIGSALISYERRNPAAQSKALTRALTAITALEIGVDRLAPLADALISLYGAARNCILNSVTSFNPEALDNVRKDLIEIRDALRFAA